MNSLLQKPEHFTRNGSPNLRTKHILTNNLLLLALLKPKVIWAGECPATARTGNWIQLKMSLGSPVRTQPNHSCQRSCEVLRAHRALLVWATCCRVHGGISSTDLHSIQGQTITPCPSEVLPKPLKISLLCEGSSNLLYYYHSCRSDGQGSSNCSVIP